MAKAKTKKVEVTLPAVAPEKKTLWQRIKDWFYNSGNIMWNWFLGVLGTAGATLVGVFSSIDWSRPMDLLRSGTTFTKEQWLMIGVGTFFAGVIGYATRVSGTKEVDGHLLPKAE